MSRIAYSQKKNTVCLLTATALFLLVGILQYFDDYVSQRAVKEAMNLAACIILIGLAVVWAFCMYNRITPKRLQRSILLLAVFVVMLLVLRFIKYRFFKTNDIVMRHLWYAYYIPQTSIPALMLSAACYVGYDERKSSIGWLKWRSFIGDVDDAYDDAKDLLSELLSLYAQKIMPQFLSWWSSLVSFGLTFAPISGLVALGLDAVSIWGLGAWASSYDDDIREAMSEYLKNIKIIKNALARIDHECMGDDVDDEDPYEDDDFNDIAIGPEYPNALYPRFDPAGFVYEAVYSNRVEGLTAKVFYKGEDGEPVFWEEASLYGEVNPQITDELGRFAWMTTIGEWLVVIYDADGNPIADSRNDPAAVDGWLPVPPPQMKVYIGITSDDAPIVSAVGASTSKVQVTFSQYMDIGYILSNPSLIGVTQDGEAIEVNISFSDMEERPAADGVFYGKVMVLTRKDGEAFIGDNICVKIDGDVKNYAGTEMGTDYSSGDITAVQIANKIEHSYPNRLIVKYGGTDSITVRVIDENGLTMQGAVVTVSASVDGIVSIESLTSTSDIDGRATFKLTGLMSGDTVLTFTTDNDISCEMNVRVTVDDEEKPKKPTSNIDDYMVVSVGSVLTFACDTPGAMIYYTTDNTCPCTDSAERKTYTGGIILTQSGFYRVAAYTEGGGYSERLNIHVIVVNYGDINGDNAVDTLDVAALRMYLAGAEIDIAPGADTNGDGVVDETDLARLRRYLVGSSSAMER